MAGKLSSVDQQTATSVRVPYIPPEFKRISVSDAWRLVEEQSDPCFLDTRNLKHYRKSDVKIAGSVRIWREDLRTRIDEVPRNRTIIAYCSCHRENSSGKAAVILYEQGITDAYALIGGLDAWIKAGLPVVPKDEWEVD